MSAQEVGHVKEPKMKFLEMTQILKYQEKGIQGRDLTPKAAPSLTRGQQA